MKKVTFFLIALLALCWQADAQSIVIGTGTSTTTSTGSDPIDGYFEAFRYQAVYTAAELSASLTPNDEITALGWSIAGDYGGGNLLGYTIKMGHTTATNSAAHNASATTVVKNAFDYNPTVTAAGVFDMITFDTNFVWNGVDNIVVEVCSDGPNPFSSPYGQVRTTTQTSGSRYYRVDGDTACATNTATTNGNRPNVQFNYIDGIPPACLNISGLTIDSFGDTDVTVSWTPSGSGETDWEIIVQEVAVADPGSGDSGTPINATTDSAPPYTVGSLSPSTDYEVFVRSYCGGTDYGAWVGPQNFTTTTPPTSVDCTGLSVNSTYCYGNNDTSSFTYQSTDGSNLRVTFNAGGIESCCDDLVIFDSDGTTELYRGANGGDLSGLVFDSTGDSITVAVDSDGSVSCSAGSTCCTADWDWNVECLSCTPAVVTSTNVIENCGAGTYDLEVTFSDLGDAQFIVGNTDPFPFEPIVPGTFVYTLAGYTSGTPADYSVVHSSPVCDFNEGPFQDACPPDNDLCAAATAIACDDTLTGQTTSGATGGSGTSCDGTIGNDVWYQYTGDNSTVTLTVTTDGEGAQIGVFESTDGTCSGFTLGSCYASEAGGSATEFVTFDADIGTEYFIQVGHYINGNPAFNFDIAATCVPYPVDPPNCDSALTSALVDFPVNGTLTWSDATGSPDGYKVSVGSSTGGTDIANNVDVGDTTSYSPTGLAYASTYYVTITPYNFNGDATSCTEETFDTEGLPPAGYVCENPIDVSAIPYTALGETTAGFGDDYTGSPGASGCGSTSSYLNGDDIVYGFTAAADGSINVDLTNITDTYTGVFIYDDCANIGTACSAGDTNGNAVTDLSISNFPVTNGNTYYIVVSTWASPQTTGYDLSITAGASCVGVSDLTVDTLTSDTVTLSWTANSGETAWEVAIQPDGTGEPGAADGSGTDTTSNPYTSPSNLTPDTAYEVWVRAECTAGTEFGDWTGPVDFSTPCAVETPDYTEDFTTFLDSCWDEANGGDLVAGPASVGTAGWLADGFANSGTTGAAKLNMFGAGPDIDWLISPTFDLSADGYEVVFDSSIVDWNGTTLTDAFNTNDVIQLVYSTDGTNWVVLYDLVTNTPAAAGEAIAVDLTGITSSTVRFAIFTSEDSTNTTSRDIDIFVDNFQVRTPPTCPDVTAIAVPTVSPTSADITWTAGGGETAWEVAVVADGAGEPDAAPGTGVATGTESYTASVSPQTDYDVYVRANCGGTYGSWIGPVSFSTPCPVFVPNYTEDFATFLDECWNEANGGDLVAGPASVGTGGWSADGFENAGTTGAAKLNMFGAGPDVDWLLSPTFDLSADGYELLFDSSIVDWNGTTLTDALNTNDVIQLVYSTDGTNWVTLYDLVANTPAGETITIDLTGISSSSVQFAFFTSEDTSNTTFRDIDIFVDNFIVRTPFACTQAVLDAADVVSDCGGGTFNIQVEFVSTGDATDVFDGTDSFPISGTSAIAGPYPIGTIVNLDVVHTDNACDFTIPGDFTDVCPPANDDFANAITFTCADASVSGNTENATLDEDDAPDAPGFNSDTDSPNVWYGFLGTGQDVTLSTINAGSNFDTEILIFTGSSGNLTYVASGYDESGAPEYLAEVTFTAEAGTQYWISVEGYNSGDTGLFQMDITCTGDPSYVYIDGGWIPSDPTGTTVPNDIVVVNGNAGMTGDTDCNSFTVRPGGGVTVPSGASVTTAAGFLLESTSTNYSSLILDGAVNGGISYERHVNINGSGSTGSNDLVSAPLTGQAFNTFAGNNPNLFDNGLGTLYLFGPFEKTGGTFVTYSNTETATLDAGVGYRAATSDNSTLTFQGTAENGTVTNDIINTEGQSSTRPEWNLVGNPYPSYLNVQDFLLHDVGGVANFQLFDATSAAIYGYDGSAINGWTIYNLATTTASTLIAPGQGFFVSADATNDDLYDLEFTASMRRTGSGDDFIVGRNAELTYVKLKASTANNSFGTDIYFNNNASLGFDLGYDATLWGGTTPEFALYSHIAQDNTGEAMAIQAINTADLSGVVIPLGVHANQGEQLTFSIDDMTLPASVNVYLEDVVANTLTLLNDSNYVITPGTELSGTGRFYLRTSEDALSTIDNDLDLLDIFTLRASDELIVSGQLLNNNTKLNLYDIQGRLVLSTTLDSALLQNRIDVSSINSGVYIVTVQNNSQEKTKKVIID